MPDDKRKKGTADWEAVLRDHPHLHVVAGTLSGRGISLISARSKTDHGVTWGVLLMVGESETETLMAIAERIKEHIKRSEEEAIRRAAEG